MSEVVVYNLDLDEELLAHLADPDAWVVIRGEKVTEDLIEDPEVTEIFRWQQGHIREHGKPATVTVLGDQFDLDFRTPETAIGDLLDRLRERYMKNRGRQRLKEIVQRQREEPLAVPQELIRAGRELSALLSKRGEVFGSGDFDRAMRRYDLKAEAGPGASFGHEMLDDEFVGMRGLNFLLGYKKAMKALALDTPIPTPQGWTAMGDIQPGDQVFDETGAITRVTAVSEIYLQHDCYRVDFSDDTTVVADGGHLWRVETLSKRRQEVLSTAQMRSALFRTNDGARNYSISVAGPLDLPEAALPIDPYTLGCWLGDGTAADACITTADPELLDGIRDAGYEVTKWTSRYQYGVLGLRTQLRIHHLLGNKHLPMAYLRSSRDQRLALLQGLMDTDGTCSDKGSCIFTTTDRELGEAVVELLRSLGFKPMVSTTQARYNGRDYGLCWAIKFMAYRDQPVFRLKRKYAAQRKRPHRRVRSQTRQIINITPVASVPVRCLTVDASSHLFLAGEGMVPTHNSWQMIQCAAENVQKGVCTWLYSLELPAEETDMRFRCLLAGIPWWRYVRSALGPTDRKALKEASELIDGMGVYRIVKPPHGQRGIQSLIHTARDGAADLILIDQLQYVENDQGKSLGRLNDPGEYWGVCDVARDLSDEGPIYIAHQFGRAAMGAESMPDIALAKGSSAIEEVCTVTLGLWANREMKENGLLQVGTLMARNAQSFGLWEIEYDLNRTCRFEITRPLDPDYA